MQEALARHRPNLTAAKHAGDGHAGGQVGHARVVVGLSKQPAPTPHARKHHQTCRRRLAGPPHHLCQARTLVLGHESFDLLDGAFSVSDVKSYSLPGAHLVADHQASVRDSHPNDLADEEVALLRLALEVVIGDAHKQRCLSELCLLRCEGLDGALQRLHRHHPLTLSAVVADLNHLFYDVPLRLRHFEEGPDRAAALCDDGLDLDVASERHANDGALSPATVGESSLHAPKHCRDLDGRHR
mmetsp:Transcript_16818/g.34429  ORF Transcript_16818/g.34429 Transcript_16818/m.34429 type:complete len:242 (+) Transcript_16818:162-887(+)